MKLWKQRLTVFTALASFATATLLIPVQRSCYGDDYFQETGSLDQEVERASDSVAVESTPMAIHEDVVPIDSLPYESGEHEAEGVMSEWIDPTSAETCPCSQSKSGPCPGVCKDPGHPKKPKHPQPGDIDEGDCPSKRYRMDDCLRSGDPHCVYKWAAPSITSKYSAWYVGGGAAIKGRGRKSSEGTWGLDYDGLFGHARTWLNYTCGKEQGGEGAYETDHVPLKKKL